MLINKLFAIEPSDAEMTAIEEDESSWSPKALEQFNRAEDLERQLAEAKEALETSIGDVCSLSRADLSEKHLEAATQAWGSAMRTMMEELAQ